MMMIVFLKNYNFFKKILLSTKSITFINLGKLDKLSFIYNHREMYFKSYITHYFLLFFKIYISNINSLFYIFFNTPLIFLSIHA